MRETDSVSRGKAIARLQRRRQRDQERRSEQAEVRQAGLDRLRVRRAAEQPTARYTRLARDRQHTHECRAAEGYRQARLERLRERNNVKLNMLQWKHQLPFISFIGMSCMIPPHCQRCSLFVALLSPHFHYQINYCQPNWKTCA